MAGGHKYEIDVNKTYVGANHEHTVTATTYPQDMIVTTTGTGTAQNMPNGGQLADRTGDIINMNVRGQLADRTGDIINMNVRGPALTGAADIYINGKGVQAQIDELKSENDELKRLLVIMSVDEESYDVD